MKIRVIAGIIVQIVSIVCPSNKNRWLYLLLNKFIKIYETAQVIIKIISIAWSWKNLNCSNRNEDPSRNKFDFQVAISKKSKLYNWGLSPMHYSAILEFYG